MSCVCKGNLLRGVVCLCILSAGSTTALAQASFQGLGVLPGGSVNDGSRAHGVSSDGSVVVGWYTTAAGNEAFRWVDLNDNGLADPNDKLELHPEFGLGDLPGGSFSSFALGVSGDGSVVAGEGSSDSGEETFRWTSGSGMVGLGSLPGAGSSFSGAFGISADGSVIVGWSNSGSGFNEIEAFRWTSGGGMVGLGDLPGGAFQSRASGVSTDGSVVVGRGVSASGQEAFIWDQTHGMRNLREVLVNSYGLDLTGWTVTRATDISADGLTIVGWGNNPNGNEEAWVATLPFPVTISLQTLAEHWLETGCTDPDWCGGADINQDGTVNLIDFVLSL